MLIDVTNTFIDWIFPKRCFACGQESLKNNICLVCLDLCHRNLNQTFFINKNCAYLFYFELTIKTLIKNVKYQRDLLSAHLLLALIQEELCSSPLIDEIIQFAPQAITFVPTHPFNRIHRAIDLPFLIARLFSHKLHVPVVSLLTRTGFKDRQALRKHKSDRLREIRGAFAFDGTSARYDRVLLVDDVVTTGATFDESSKILKERCKEIRSIAIAKTP
jgi:predicted amidophosphoribosyltransferase